MKPYEGLFIFPPEGTPEVLKNQIAGLEAAIKKFDGNVLEKIEMGKRLLGYPLKKFREGFCVTLHFQMNPAKSGEFRKALELQADLLKYMILVKDLAAQKKPEPKLERAPAHHHPDSPKAPSHTGAAHSH